VPQGTKIPVAPIALLVMVNDLISCTPDVSHYKYDLTLCQSYMYMYICMIVRLKPLSCSSNLTALTHGQLIIWSWNLTLVSVKSLSHAFVEHKETRLMLDFETSNSKLEVSKSNSWKITSFSSFSEGAVSHNVLYYQSLPSTRNQERFYDDYYFE
jgi:hypothetical protein